jgi:hypothetical protein
LGSLVRPCHLDRNAFWQARPEVACRYRTDRVALRETARLKIVPQVREEGKRCPSKFAAVARASEPRDTLSAFDAEHAEFTLDVAYDSSKATPWLAMTTAVVVRQQRGSSSVGQLVALTDELTNFSREFCFSFPLRDLIHPGGAGGQLLFDRIVWRFEPAQSQFRCEIVHRYFTGPIFASKPVPDCGDPAFIQLRNVENNTPPRTC